jgi:hypothetical protein
MRIQTDFKYPYASAIIRLRHLVLTNSDRLDYTSFYTTLSIEIRIQADFPSRIDYLNPFTSFLNE